MYSGMYRYSDVSSAVSAVCYSVAAGMTVRGVAATAFVSATMSSAAMSFGHCGGRDCERGRHRDYKSEIP